jgi:hypothetical protein
MMRLRRHVVECLAEATRKRNIARCHSVDCIYVHTCIKSPLFLYLGAQGCKMYLRPALQQPTTLAHEAPKVSSTQCISRRSSARASSRSCNIRLTGHHGISSSALAARTRQAIVHSSALPVPFSSCYISRELSITVAVYHVDPLRQAGRYLISPPPPQP